MSQEITDSDVFDANKELAKFANKQVSDQLNFLLDHYDKSLENAKLKAEIDFLERRVEELEEEVEPEESYSETRRTMLEDFD